MLLLGLERFRIEQRTKNPSNPCFAYYNINSLKFKIDDLKETVKKVLPEVLVFAETKLNDSYTDPQFFIENYYNPSRKDFTLNSGGLIEYIRKGILHKNFKSFSACKKFTSERRQR